MTTSARDSLEKLLGVVAGLGTVCAVMGYPAVALHFHKYDVPLDLMPNTRALEAGILPMLALLVAFVSVSSLNSSPTSASGKPRAATGPFAAPIWSIYAVTSLLSLATVVVLFMATCNLLGRRWELSPFLVALGLAAACTAVGRVVLPVVAKRAPWNWASVSYVISLVVAALTPVLLQVDSSRPLIVALALGEAVLLSVALRSYRKQRRLVTKVWWMTLAGFFISLGMALLYALLNRLAILSMGVTATWLDIPAALATGTALGLAAFAATLTLQRATSPVPALETRPQEEKAAKTFDDLLKVGLFLRFAVPIVWVFMVVVGACLYAVVLYPRLPRTMLGGSLPPVYAKVEADSGKPPWASDGRRGKSWQGHAYLFQMSSDDVVLCGSPEPPSQCAVYQRDSVQALLVGGGELDRPHADGPRHRRHHPAKAASRALASDVRP